MMSSRQSLYTKITVLLQRTALRFFAGHSPTFISPWAPTVYLTSSHDNISQATPLPPPYLQILEAVKCCEQCYIVVSSSGLIMWNVRYGLVKIGKAGHLLALFPISLFCLDHLCYPSARNRVPNKSMKYSDTCINRATHS